MSTQSSHPLKFCVKAENAGGGAVFATGLGFGLGGGCWVDLTGGASTGLKNGCFHSYRLCEVSHPGGTCHRTHDRQDVNLKRLLNESTANKYGQTQTSCRIVKRLFGCVESDQYHQLYMWRRFIKRCIKGTELC